MKNKLRQVFFLIVLFLLFLYPKECLDGAKNGLMLWAHTIVPTLLPFLLLTGFLKKFNVIESISYVFYPIYKLFPNLNKNLPYTLVLGFFCGYPLGAKIVNDLVLEKGYTKKEGQCLLCVSNHISPMFSLGYTLTHILNNQLPSWKFFLALYLPSVLYLLLHMFFIPKFLQNEPKQISISPTLSFDEILRNSIYTICTIGIYIMIFSLAANLVLQLGSNIFFKNFLLGITEVTTGVNHIGSLSISLHKKASYLCGASAFGGFCSIMQTYSVCKKSQLSMTSYVLWKSILAGCSMLLAFIII